MIKQRKVLIIEDDPFQQELYRDWSPNPFLLFFSATVSKAAALFLALEPEVLILDYSMPDGTGLDFLQNLEDSNAVRNTRIYLVSGMVDQITSEQMESLKDRGVLDVHRKPITFDEFQVLISGSTI